MFDTFDYRKIIARTIEQNRSVRGYQSRIADTIGCQRSYFSRVLQSKVELTEEHASLLCKFWQLSHLEAEYFISTVQLARADNEYLHDIIKARLHRLKEENKKISERLSRSSHLTAEHQNIYYTSWLHPVIHMIVTLPDLQTSAAIAAMLGVDENMVLKVLSELAEMGLVGTQDGHWQIVSNDLHLNADATLANLHHIIWRQHNISNLLAAKRKMVSYTGLHTLDKDKFEEFHESYLALLQQLRKLAAESHHEAIMVSFVADLDTLVKFT